MPGWPTIIQGGMGVGISDWRVARAVARLGQLGVVSGTALDQVFARRLQEGDPDGHLRRALEHFPFPEMAGRVLRLYFRAGGKPAREAYRTLPMQAKDNPRELQELCIVANFAEVWLAREGHDGPVGINYLEKIQIPHLPSLYGSMLAGVGYVLMGAGVPMKIPGVLERFVRHEDAVYPLHVAGAEAEDDHTITFAPREYMECDLPLLARPRFLAIVASATLAATLLARANGVVDGFVVEGPAAGGHNAPPRGRLQLDAAGEPIYGERDRVDLGKMRELGRPFWLAGGYGTPEKLAEALTNGAAGVQVGTAFAYCAESGMRADLRRAVLEQVAAGGARVATDAQASPTGFPFKVVQLAGTLSEATTYAARPRICDLGYLREPYRTPEGGIGFRCPAEPVSLYVSKGGRAENTTGRKCLCNGLVATCGHPQARNGKHIEPGIVTSGDELPALARFLPPASTTYAAADVVETLLAGVGAGQAQ